MAHLILFSHAVAFKRCVCILFYCIIFHSLYAYIPSLLYQKHESLKHAACLLSKHACRIHMYNQSIMTFMNVCIHQGEGEEYSDRTLPIEG